MVAIGESSNQCTSLHSAESFAKRLAAQASDKGSGQRLVKGCTQKTTLLTGGALGSGRSKEFYRLCENCGSSVPCESLSLIQPKIASA